MTGLVRAAHAGPALAVVVLAVLLAVSFDLSAGRTALVGLAVLAGQLSVGWSNDLVDEARDRAVGRSDKPIASGDVGAGTVRAACGVAVVAVVVLSLACGWAAGVVHLLAVASAWAYNLGLKSTAWSWAPYAFSFGALVVFVALAGEPSTPPSWWLVAAAALLGVGAHLLNVLPDLGDDAATGVRGLPHRLGARRLPAVATAVLVAGSVLVVLGTGADGRSLVALGLVAVLAVVAVVGAGGRVDGGVAGGGSGGGGVGSRLPFAAAVGIALVDVVLLASAR
jgi:4-hydroxybenzoate polyprenyltransferase